MITTTVLWTCPWVSKLIGVWKHFLISVEVCQSRPNPSPLTLMLLLFKLFLGFR